MIRGWLVGERQVQAKFDRIMPSVREQLKQEVTRLAIKLTAHVKADYLSGQVLKNRTGKLRGSVNEKVEDSDSKVEAAVGPNMEQAQYAAAWEFGFDRKVGAGARGGPNKITGRALDYYFTKHPPGTKHVDARPYMRPALRDMADEIKKGMERAVRKGAA